MAPRSEYFFQRNVYIGLGVLGFLVVILGLGVAGVILNSLMAENVTSFKGVVEGFINGNSLCKAGCDEYAARCTTDSDCPDIVPLDGVAIAKFCPTTGKCLYMYTPTGMMIPVSEPGYDAAFLCNQALGDDKAMSCLRSEAQITSGFFVSCRASNGCQNILPTAFSMKRAEHANGNILESTPAYDIEKQ
jgi:hypothetical protein